MRNACPNWGKYSAIEGKHSAIKGKYSAIRGKHSAIRGKHSAIKGKHSAIEGKSSAIRGKHSAIKDRLCYFFSKQPEARPCAFALALNLNTYANATTQSNPKLALAPLHWR